VVRLNQTSINEETAVYRVVLIQWQNLITSIDNSTSTSDSSEFKVSGKQNCFSKQIIYFIEEHFIHGIFDEWTGK
jgi:hypothetical protein